MKARLLVVLLIALGFASSAQAQSRQVVVDQLEAAADLFAVDNFVVDRKASGHEVNIGLLAGNTRVLLEIWLEEGNEYLVGAACDEDCTDLDMSLLSPTGSTLDEDVEIDAFPILEIVAPSTGWYTLNISLIDCDTNLCYFGYQVYQRVLEI